MSGKLFVGSVLISLIGMGLITIFAIPLLYPGLQIGTVNQGIVYQSKYLEISSLAQVDDSQISSMIQVPDTVMNITVQSKSRIYALFNSHYILGISNALDSDRVAFQIVLKVEDVGQRTSRIAYYEVGTYPDAREFSSTFTLNYLTEQLTKGTYKVGLYWISMSEQDGFNYLLFSTPAANYTRTLLVQEYGI